MLIYILYYIGKEKRIMKKVLMVLTMVFVLASVTVAKPLGSGTKWAVEQAIVKNEEQILNDKKVAASTDNYIEWLETTDFSEKVIKKSDLKKVNSVKKELDSELRYYRVLCDVSVKLWTKMNEGYKKALEENDTKYFYKPVSTAEVELSPRINECEKKLRSLDFQLKETLKIYGYN